MNFLRKRLFVFYGMLLVFAGGVPGGKIAEMIHPAAHRARDAATSDEGLFSGSSSAAIVIAHVLLVAFVIYLHLQKRDAEVIGQPPRQWLMFTYGAYAIGFVLGAILTIAMQ